MFDKYFDLPCLQMLTHDDWVTHSTVFNENNANTKKVANKIVLLFILMKDKEEKANWNIFVEIRWTRVRTFSVIFSYSLFEKEIMLLMTDICELFLENKKL